MAMQQAPFPWNMKPGCAVALRRRVVRFLRLAMESGSLVSCTPPLSSRKFRLTSWKILASGP